MPAAAEDFSPLVSLERPAWLSSIAADGSGNIYVGGIFSDPVLPYGYREYSVVKYSFPDYAAADWQGGSCNSGGISTNNIAVNSAGSVHMTDREGGRLLVVDPDLGNMTYHLSYGNGSGELFGPFSVAIDAGGYIYISDAGNRVQRFDPALNYVSQFGYSGNPHLFVAISIAVDGGVNLYAVDYGNAKLIVFNRVTGEFIRQWDYKMGLWFPVSVAVDSGGGVYVLNMTENEIEKFDQYGNFLKAFGKNALGAEYLKNPRSIAIAGDKLYVLDEKILVFDLGLE